ncbi:BTB/POZ domain-containing protein At3g19850-like [Wolffia australiana]
MQEDAPDLRVRIHGRQELFLHQRILCLFSGSLCRAVRKEKRRARAWVELDLPAFPGGAAGFELAARFCYGGGRIKMSPSNVAALRCAAVALEMTDDVAACNLLAQTDAFLDGIFYWTWGDVVAALKSCEGFADAAEDCGLLRCLAAAVHAKISDSPLSSAASSSPDGYPHRSSSSSSTPGAGKEWWFEDLAAVEPRLVERLVGGSGGGLVMTRFLLHYLRKRGGGGGCGGLADAAARGVAMAAPAGFSCRGLFRVLRVVAGQGLSKGCRAELEGLIGSALDQATLDDLLVSGHDDAVYDVSLVVRLLRVFVSSGDVALQKMKKVGRLMDKYLREISPDHSLKPSKFLAVAESLPDSARDCFDGVYRALDIYLESHPGLTCGERSRLCRCLNYEKLTLETCKELAKNPRIPPRSAVRALAAAAEGKKEELRQNLQTMQWRVAELEKMCRQMKGQMSRMNQTAVGDIHGRGLPKLC